MLALVKNLFYVEACILIGYALFHVSLSRKARSELHYRPLIVFGGLTAICFLSPGIWVAHILLFLFPFVLARASVNAGIAVALGLMAIPSIVTELSAGSVPLISYSLHHSLTLGALAALVFSPGRLPKHPMWTNAPLIVILLLLAVMSARGTSFTNGLRQLTSLGLTFALPIYVVTRSLKSLKDVRLLLISLAAAGAMLSVVVLFETRSSWPLYELLDSKYGIIQQGVIVKFRGVFMRAYGPLGEATAMGYVLVICLGAAIASRRAFASSIAATCIPILIAVGLFAPQSRGGIVGAAIVFVVALFYRDGIRGLSRFALAGMLIAGAYMGGALVDRAMGGKVAAGMTAANDTVDYRQRLLDRGLEEFYKNPITGDSYDNVVRRMSDMVQGEGIVDFVNSYLYFALFSGFFGFVTFCLVFICSAWLMLRRRNNIEPKSFNMDVTGYCLALVISSMFMLAFSSFMGKPAILTIMLLQIGISAAYGLYKDGPKRDSNPERIANSAA